MSTYVGDGIGANNRDTTWTLRQPMDREANYKMDMDTQDDRSGDSQVKSGKSFDTGVLSQYLRLLKADRQNNVASERASHILQLNSKRGGRNVNNVPQRVVNCESLLKQWVSYFLILCCSCCC
jgi:hypothetical protein